MPRPGAITRSMTRAGAASLHSTPMEVKASTNGALAEITVNHPTATNMKSSSIFNSSDPEPLTPRTMVPANISSSTIKSAELLTQNRMTILRLEQDGALAPGILTIEPSGELRADLTIEPDQGTMTGLFPNMAPAPDMNEQIPSWVRDYLVKILNVHGHGPPALCRAFYDHLKNSQDELGINNSVRTAESHLAYATISLRYAVEEVKDFVNMRHAFRDTYDEEVYTVIKTIKRLVGYEGEATAKAMPQDVRMLFGVAEMGATMKEALDEPLESLIITPYTQLLEKLELVSKALRIELDRTDQETDKARELRDPQYTRDSGIDEC